MRCVRMESTANTRPALEAASWPITGSSLVVTVRKMRLVFSSGFSFFTARLSYSCGWQLLWKFRERGVNVSHGAAGGRLEAHGGWGKKGGPSPADAWKGKSKQSCTAGASVLPGLKRTSQAAGRAPPGAAAAIPQHPLLPADRKAGRTRPCPLPPQPPGSCGLISTPCHKVPSAIRCCELQRSCTRRTPPARRAAAD